MLRFIRYGVTAIAFLIMGLVSGVCISDAGAGPYPVIRPTTHVRAQSSVNELILNSFRAVEKKDVELTLSYFTEDAEVFDPHYPMPLMKGKDQIRKGLQWGINTIETFRFEELNFLERSDGQLAVFEVQSKHKVRNGPQLDFPQMFVFQLQGGKISAMRAYEPYGLHGVGQITLLVDRLRGAGR